MIRLGIALLPHEKNPKDSLNPSNRRAHLISRNAPVSDSDHTCPVPFV